MQRKASFADPTVRRRVLRAIREAGPWGLGDLVVVAVSGGADSLCLLDVLDGLETAPGLRLHVAHLDHGLRPESSLDAAAVAAEAGRRGLPYTVERHRPPDDRARRLGPEGAARAVRYAFLRDVKEREGARYIATGHTRDDQAETMLLHLARGSGLAGAAGIRPVQGDLWRPLLAVSRHQTAAYCTARDLAPRHDPSNDDLAFSRNKVRHTVLPALETVQHAARANLARAAGLLAADLALVERLALAALDAATWPCDDGHGPAAVLHLARWREADPALRPHMLRLLLYRLQGHARGVGAPVYAALERAVIGTRQDAVVELPGRRLVLRRKGETATLGPWQKGTAALLDPVEGQRRHAPVTITPCLLPIPGFVVTEGGRLDATLGGAPLSWAGVPRTTAYLDPTKVGPTLRVRGRRAGDRLRPLGAAGSRSLQDVLVDAKAPRERRDLIPIVEGIHGIAWVAGVRVAEPYRVSVAGDPAVRLNWSSNERLLY